MTGDLQSLVVILAAAALAPLLVDLPSRLRLPAVVAEITLGILIGPQVLGFAEPEGVVEFLSTVGLAFLFFLGGLEVDFDRVRGLPAKLGGYGWLISLALGLTIAFGLEEIGFVLSTELVGVALCTTAIGTLMPILRDAGELKRPLGPFVLAAGVAGEFGPLVVVALVLTTGRTPGVAFALLIAFVVISVLTAVVALRARTPRMVTAIHDAMASSGQAAVRLALVVLFGLVFLASEFGFDIVLGAFAAGLVVGLVTKTAATEDLRLRLETIGFGFVVPIFFVVTGMEFDLAALFESPTDLLRLPVFLVLFLLVRGAPVFLLYRSAIPRADRVPMALYSATALPLVVAITTIGLETGHMRPENAAALVGAAMVSVLVYPLLALTLRRRRPAAAEASMSSA
jgi:Kef-type K+ transport system membrane component KefB